MYSLSLKIYIFGRGNPCLITALPLRCMNTQMTSYSNIVMTFKHTNILINGILISPTYRAKMCGYFKPNPMKIRPVVQKLCPIEGSVHFKAYSHEITSKQTPPCEMTWNVRETYVKRTRNVRETSNVLSYCVIQLRDTAMRHSLSCNLIGCWLHTTPVAIQTA